MPVRSLVLLMAVLGGTAAARAEAIATARLMFADAWKRSECNQIIDVALNNARYHELGGGYALGMVLCWLGPYSETQILFLVAPKTSGRPQLLRFEEWRGQKFELSDVLSIPQYNSDTRKIVSYRPYSRRGVCGAAGEWTWTGSAFRMTGYWDKPDCNDESEFDRGDRFRVFPPKK
jgi:hypothetical protein